VPSEVNTAEANWLILYTKPRFEKKVALRLQEIGVAFYLPLHKTLKQWSDRRKWVEEPLFKSYVFVKHEPTRYFDVLNIPGAVKFIHFSGELATIRSSKIHEIKLLLSNFSDVDVVSMEHVEPSDNVRVIAGPLQGLKGKALAYKGKQVLAVEVEHIGQSLVIQLPVKYLEKI
jgi:transcription antitermination factor NusG